MAYKRKREDDDHNNTKKIKISEDKSIIVCPISQQIYKDPVFADDGYVYERDCIIEWMETETISPITREHISNNIKTAYPIKTIVENYLENNPSDKILQFDNSIEHMSNRKLVWSYIKDKKYNKLLDIREFVLLDKNNGVYLITELAENNISSTIMLHILKNSIDYNITFSTRHSVLTIIVFNSYSFECIKFLLDNGADVNVASYNNHTISHVMMRGLLYQDDQIIQVIDLVNNLNKQNIYGNTLLHEAVINKRDYIIDYLIEKGSDINIIDKKHRTFIHYMMEYQHYSDEIITKYVDILSNINFLDNKGQTLLHYSMIKDMDFLSEYLVEKGIDVNILDTYGYTSMFYYIIKHKKLHHKLLDKIDYNIISPIGSYFEVACRYCGFLELYGLLDQMIVKYKSNKYKIELSNNYNGDIYIKQLNKKISRRRFEEDIYTNDKIVGIDKILLINVYYLIANTFKKLQDIDSIDDIIKKISDTLNLDD